MEHDTKVIGFEGDDGSGKSAMSKYLSDLLIARGFKVLHVAQSELPPYATKIREIVTGPVMSTIDIEVKALMFATYLLDIYDKTVKANLGKYDYIILDRTIYSTLVYQDGSAMLTTISSHLKDIMPIDILVYLDMVGDIGIKRIKKNRDGQLDDTELKSTGWELFRRRKLYQHCFNSFNGEYKFLIDAGQTESEVCSCVGNIIEVIRND